MAVNQARPGRNPLPDGAAAPLWSRFSKAMLAFQFVQREFPTGFSARETMNQFPLIGFGFRFSRSETTIPYPIHRFALAGSNRSHQRENVYLQARFSHFCHSQSHHSGKPSGKSTSFLDTSFIPIFAKLDFRCFQASSDRSALVDVVHRFRAAQWPQQAHSTVR